ncbi:MAG: multicopper oxidase domain-containing protein [Thermoanaerobaculia bacterium]|nr:multicopper oxidase domain-containing protein [Thermoanaerobaculia bacterium]
MKNWSVWIVFFLSASLSAQPVKTIELTTSEDGTVEMPDGSNLPVWSFQIPGSPAGYPGPRLVVEEGDSVRVGVYNAGSMAHTFHLHGFGSDTSNNGEPMNPLIVQPGNTGVFSFRANAVGDYYYHCGLQNPIHGQMGMAGLLTVLVAGGEKRVYTGGPKFFKDYHWLLGEIDKEWRLNPPKPGNLPSFLPDYFLINGRSGDALGDYTGDVAILTALDQLPVFLTVTHSGVGRREVVFPEMVLATVVVRNGEPQIPAMLIDTLDLLPGESFGVMLQPALNGEDSIRVNYYAPAPEVLWYQNAAAIYIQHHSATSEAAAGNPVQILPNPVADFLTVQFHAQPPKGKIEVEIFSEAGDSVLRQDISPDQRIPVQRLATGIYFLKIMGENGRIIAGRTFVKK